MERSLSNIYHPVIIEQDLANPVKIRDLKIGQRFMFTETKRVHIVTDKTSEYVKYKRPDDWTVRVDFKDPISNKIVYLI